MKTRIYNSAGAEKVQNAPPEYLMGEELAYATITTTFVQPSTAAANVYNAGLSVTVTGDGVNPVVLTCTAAYAESNAATPTFGVMIVDGGTGTPMSGFTYTAGHAIFEPSGTGKSMPVNVTTRIAPFTGTKTFTVATRNDSGGAATVSLYADANVPATLRAFRAKSVAQYAVPSCRVYNSTNFSVGTSGTDTLVTFDSERWDTSSMHSTASNTGRIYAPVAGIYDLKAHLNFAANGTGQRYAFFKVNGSRIVALTTQPANATIITAVNPSSEVKLNAGDYVEVWAWQNSGGALNISASSEYSPDFSMTFVGPGTDTPAISGKELLNGYVEKTSNHTTATLNSGGTVREALSTMNITVTGDGITPVLLEFWCAGNWASTLGTNPTALNMEIWDGTVGSGTKVCVTDDYLVTTSQPRGAVHMRRRVAAFTGSKTFTVAVSNNTASNSVFVIDGFTAAPMYLRATWV